MTKNNLKIVKSDDKKDKELKEKNKSLRRCNQPNRPKLW